MSELKITQEKVTAAFSEANDCPKAISILTALFGKQKPDYGECQTSCQSACKTSCGVANQKCENSNK